MSSAAAPLTLALSTVSPALSLALFAGDRLIAHDHRLIGRGHAEALVPAIAALLGTRRPAAIIVDVGPGSFTGIRIGIAAARALGLAWGVPVTGCTAGSLVAAQAFAADSGLAAVTTFIDAGRGQLFRQRVAADFAAGPVDTVAADAPGLAPGEPAAGAVSGRAPHAGHPDAAYARYLPAAARSLPPEARYVRPPDAILPL